MDLFDNSFSFFHRITSQKKLINIFALDLHLSSLFTIQEKENIHE
jgi:hypothetical protein